MEAWACKCGRFKGLPLPPGSSIDADGELHQAGGCVPAQQDPRDQDRREPPPGSWAETARLMHSIDPDFDWDSWKDEMKENDHG